MATDQLINKTQGDAIISGLTAIKNAINDQPVPTQIEDVVADAFDVGVSYVPGDYCIYENKLYICDVAHHGAWDGNDFTLTTVGAVLESLNNALKYNLIWTNTSPTADFAAQTLQLGDTYSEIEVMFVDVKVNGTNPGDEHLVAKRLVSGDASQVSFVGTGGGNFFNRCRDMFFNGSAIAFSTGYMQGYGSSGVVNTGYTRADQMIPYKVLARK